MRFRAPIMIVACLPLAGCGGDPRAVLESMARAYRETRTYSDDARVRIEIARGDATTERTVPFRVAFSRPDRVRIDAYDARIASDGTTLRAAAGHVPGQVLAEPVRPPLSLEQIIADREVRGTLTEGEAGCPTQLPLLMADDTLDVILADAIGPPRIAGHESIDGHPCARVEIRKPDGLLVLWIDRGTSLLRRMRVPTDAYAELVSRQSGGPTGVSVVVDFTEASFTRPPPDEAFAFVVPAGAAEVSRLEPLRPPAALHPLVGRTAPEFSLSAADGSVVSRASLGGSAAVLEFFFTGCEPCGRIMPQVAEAIAACARRSGPDATPTRHLAVSIDAEAGITDLRRLLAEYGGVGALHRDPGGEVAAAIGLDRLPAVVILAADGTVADVLVGEERPFVADVDETLTALAEGRDAVGLVKSRHEKRLRDYRRSFAAAAGGGERGTAASRPVATIAARRQPDRFKLVRAWRAAGAMLPGNLVCIDQAHGGPADARVVVLDGWRSVVVLDAAGRESSRHELTIPADAAVGMLRTAVDAEGRRWWIAYARGRRELFVFDEGWHLRTTIPGPGGAPPGGVAGCELVDLDGDATPEIVVARAEAAGLEAFDLDGAALWTSGGPATVQAVAAGAPGSGRRDVLCTDAEGCMTRIKATGEVVASPRVVDPRLHGLWSGPVAADGGWAILGISRADRGPSTALGLGPAGERLWELPLAEGGHGDSPVDPVAWADLLGSLRPQWLIAEPDGSVTIAWADGGVVGRYCHGAAILGVGGYRHGDAGYVVLATRSGIESLRLEDVALD